MCCFSEGAHNPVQVSVGNEMAGLNLIESQGIRIKTADVAKSNNISQSVPRATCIGLKRTTPNSERAGK